MSRNGKRLDANNDMHVCDCPRNRLVYAGESLKDSSLESDELILVWDFYVSHAPILKSKASNGDGFGLRFLGEYGWNRKADHTSLERKLLTSAKLRRFVMVRADKISDTLSLMNLDGEICWEHPRAVLKQNYSISVNEDGTVSITNAETRMQCLFRHIRNALAHNRIYFSPNGEKILLEDADEKDITARILIPIRSLIKWVEIIDKERKYYFKNDEIAMKTIRETKEAV